MKRDRSGDVEGKFQHMRRSGVFAPSASSSITNLGVAGTPCDPVQTVQGGRKLGFFVGSETGFAAVDLIFYIDRVWPEG
ncbi:MAG: hypothetical protein AAF212_10710 [Verrucomicrobiota bacterium]